MTDRPGLAAFITNQIGTPIWFVSETPNPHRNEDYELRITPEQRANFAARFDRINTVRCSGCGR